RYPDHSIAFAPICRRYPEAATCKGMEVLIHPVRTTPAPRSAPLALSIDLGMHSPAYTSSRFPHPELAGLYEAPAGWYREPDAALQSFGKLEYAASSFARTIPES